MGLAPLVEGESSKAMADLSKYDIIFGVKGVVYGRDCISK